MYCMGSCMLHLNDDDNVDNLNYFDYYRYSVSVLLKFVVVELLLASLNNDADMHLLLLPLLRLNEEMLMLICMRMLRMRMMVMLNLLY